MADYFELTDVSVHKASAVKQLAKLLDIEEDEVAVYGDGLNDVTMLSSFKHSYAPSNANKKVQLCANEVIGSYLDYAVCKHMLKTLEDER
jgi:hydroxymethylpyrimidine pyrophosphatase-like HAD family hydrolase